MSIAGCRTRFLLLAGGLLVVLGCARGSVAINQAALADAEKKPAPPTTEKAAPTSSGAPFRFPDDRGGKLLGQLLTPPAQLPGDGQPSAAPLVLLPPAAVDRPEVQPVVVAQPTIPRPGIDARAQKVKPH